MTTNKAESLGVDQEGSTANTEDAEDGSTRRPLPMHRVHPKNDSGVIVIDGAFSHDDGWSHLTVGWVDDAIRDIDP